MTTEPDTPNFVSPDGTTRFARCTGMRSGSTIINGVDVFGSDGKLSVSAIKAGWKEGASDDLEGG